MKLINLTTADLQFYKENPESRKDKIGDLMPSLKKYGLLSPLVVEQNSKKYVAIDGNRRLNAVLEFEKQYEDLKNKLNDMKKKRKERTEKILENWSKFFNEDGEFTIPCLEREKSEVEMCSTEEYFSETNRKKSKLTGREQQEMYFQTGNEKLITKRLLAEINFLKKIYNDEDIKEKIFDKGNNISTFTQTYKKLLGKLNVDLKEGGLFENEEKKKLMEDAYDWMIDNYTDGDLITLRDDKLKNPKLKKSDFMKAIENEEQI